MERLVTDPFLIRLETAAVFLVVIFLLVRYARRSIGRYVADSNSRYVARKVVTVIGYVLAVAVLATLFSDRLGGLTVAFGLAGAGIAFALQEVIVSVAGFAAISLGRTYQTGDRVSVGGVKGDVIDISVLRTTLMELGEWVNGDLYSGRIVRVSNSVLFKDPVFNYSADFPFLWDEIRVPVRHGSDRASARAILEQVAAELTGEFAARSTDDWQGVVRKYRIENARIEPMVTMVADENWMTFTVRYIVDYKRRRALKDRMFMKLLDEIEATGGAVRLATGALELTAGPTLDVRLLEREKTA